MIFFYRQPKQASYAEGAGGKNQKRLFNDFFFFFDVKTAVLDQQILITVGMATEKREQGISKARAG